VTEPDDLAERLARLEELERRYGRAEEKNVARKQATVRRGPVSLVAVCLGVALLVGITAAVDLRRLQTPGGTAMAWTAAAVFGDCTAYGQLSVRPDGDERDADERCQSLRAASQQARDRPDDVELELLSTAEDGDRASAVVRVRRPGLDGEAEVPLSMRARRGGWQVELTDAACAALPCP
jgi:hypothetical protein